MWYQCYHMVASFWKWGCHVVSLLPHTELYKGGNPSVWYQLIPHKGPYKGGNNASGLRPSTMPYHFHTTQWALRALYRLSSRISLITHGGPYGPCIDYHTISLWYHTVGPMGPIYTTIPYQFDTTQWALRALYRLPCCISLIPYGPYIGGSVPVCGIRIYSIALGQSDSFLHPMAHSWDNGDLQWCNIVWHNNYVTAWSRGTVF